MFREFHELTPEEKAIYRAGARFALTRFQDDMYGLAETEDLDRVHAILVAEVEAKR